MHFPWHLCFHIFLFFLFFLLLKSSLLEPLSRSRECAEPCDPSGREEQYNALQYCMTTSYCKMIFFFILWTFHTCIEYLDHIQLPLFSSDSLRPPKTSPPNILSSLLKTHWIQLVLAICKWMWAIHEGTSNPPVPHPQSRWLSPSATTSSHGSSDRSVVSLAPSPCTLGVFNWLDLGQVFLR